jgi:hypothetical protein
LHSNRFLEHGKFYPLEGGISEFYTLAYSSGLTDSKKLLETLAFPGDSKFGTTLGAVSFAFLPFDPSKNEYVFVQIQCRRESEPPDYETENSRGRWFNQTRFTVLDLGDVRSLFAEGFCLFNHLVVDIDGSFHLQKYDHVVGEVADVPRPIFQLPDLAYRTVVSKPAIAGAIRKIASGLRKTDQVIITYEVDDFTLFERLVIVQEIQRILLPIWKIPVSFTLDYIAHPSSRINIRFQKRDEANQSAARLIQLGDQDLVGLDDYIEGICEFLFSETSSLNKQHQENWQDRHRLLFGDEIGRRLASEDRADDAAEWLSGIVLSRHDTFRYYKTLFEFSDEIEQPLYNDYFIRKYQNLKNNKELFNAFLVDSSLAKHLLFSISQSGLVETEFTFKDWAEIVIYSGVEKDDKKLLFDSYRGGISLDDARHLLIWTRDKKDKILWGNENIMYGVLKAKLDKNSGSAEFVLRNLSTLLQAGFDREIEYWCQFLVLPVETHSIWVWVNSVFKRFKDEIFIQLLEKEYENAPYNALMLVPEDRKRLVALRHTDVLNHSRLAKLLLNRLDEESVRTNPKGVMPSATITAGSPKNTLEPILSGQTVRIPLPEDQDLPKPEKKAKQHPHTKDRARSHFFAGRHLRMVISIVFIFTGLVSGLLFADEISGWFKNLPNTVSPPYVLTPEETLIPMPADTPSPSPVTTIQVQSWEGQGYLYFIRTEEGVEDPTRSQEQNLYLLSPDFQLTSIQKGLLNDVFLNRDNLLFYMSIVNENTASIRFINVDGDDSELVPPYLLFNKPSVYPGKDKAFDAAMICDMFDLCLLSRQYEVGAVITRYDLDEQNMVSIVEPWSGASQFPNSRIDALSWLTETDLVFSLDNPGSPGVLYRLSLQQQLVTEWQSIPATGPIIDIERWPGSTPEASTFALLEQATNQQNIYVVELKNGIFPPSFEIKKFELPELIHSVEQLQWDPQKNKIAFIGTLDKDGSNCKVGCMFLLDLIDGRVMLTDLGVGDGILSIFWSTSTHR